MAARANKSQARRKGGGNAGMPGWAWLILGVLMTLLAVLALPRFMGGGEDGGFLRPRPNPDARPQPVAIDEAGVVDDARRAAPAPEPADAAASAQNEDYDFYTLLPEQEVEMSDAQLQAAAREEAERRQRLAAQQAAQAPQPLPDAAPVGTPDAAASGSVTAVPVPTPATTAGSTAAASAPPRDVPAPPSSSQTPYILQAGSFAASGDAEAVKARIALLGLNARVESATINGKTMYRVRMGPYGTATELADAKSKLASGGLPAMAIKAR